MDEERMRVLDLLDKGCINAAEATELLLALAEPARRHETRLADSTLTDADVAEAPGDRAHWVRIRVTDKNSGRERANLAVPLSLIDLPLNIARSFGALPANGAVEALLAILRDGRPRALFGMNSEQTGDRIELLVD